ncbi:MAG TPA: DUF4304 domain-containing protein [Sediminibacterium sp.]|uniref:DUF4304 domain-containing protein n=1 Tax=Sediminibacterium sp. TaxID=1917865 RepID=UPI0008D8251A|nr:DUF4304 domain-containing protein [Sediminibacterium sp.]OFZ56444.1 MAG: hypothetical protein A2328_03330 [Bdellovibrionales bacterium RIFOXYB2_FULL_36_6]OHC84801.1 MAG: hypothetical protein A2472_14055 [Sphingobacteriia bacterium RIFOXYC2_FULL_35_18]OHC88172.1 MAG: hypothetical protein A2546_00825 [Sphingobacteriia bacterium RIFOXYD2_FULL_35_12]HLD53318.1 DUF4304 domain-containing protein [Sediminibacterium sp.]
MKTVTEQNFEIIIKDCFQTILKPLGFKKKGNNFYRQLQDLGQIINVQKSSLYSKDHISFTINTGLFIPEYWLTFYTYHNGTIPDYPTEPICAIRQRIGKLKYNIDKWFDLDPSTDIAALKNETIDNILNHILPYFEKAKTKADIIQLLQDENTPLDKFGRLIIFGEYNQLEKAQVEYDRLKQDKYTFANMKSTLFEYRDKYKLVD